MASCASPRRSHATKCLLRRQTESQRDFVHLRFAGGGSFVPDGTSDKATRKPSDQSLGYFLSPFGLDDGSPASEASLAGLRQTGLLAANASRTFSTFIFKNALAANIGKGSRLKVSGFR